eukprot:TRINITY_DN66174_c0_g1_i1.p1 TRINITY_DN66174_c0_g1~~TRINITY_DN66174_c0_g1_i1.p1  ORF type:complete len:339 (+),score=59.73 TRINITY_DN66174_c0_g1_i1:38-1018(+)
MRSARARSQEQRQASVCRLETGVALATAGWLASTWDWPGRTASQDFNPILARSEAFCRGSRFDPRHVDKSLLRALLRTRKRIQRWRNGPQEVLVTRTNANDLHDAKEDICALFRLYPCPDLYITAEEHMRAESMPACSARSGDSGRIVLSVAVLEQLSTLEVRAVLAHEMAHTVLKHFFQAGFLMLDWYRLLILSDLLTRGEHPNDLESAAAILSLLLVHGLRGRAGELMADRAMLAVVDLQTALSALVKMHLPDAESPLQLAEEASDSAARHGLLLRTWMLLRLRSHPCLQLRVAALRAFAASPEAKSLKSQCQALGLNGKSLRC